MKKIKDAIKKIVKKEVVEIKEVKEVKASSDCTCVGGPNTPGCPHA